MAQKTIYVLTAEERKKGTQKFARFLRKIIFVFVKNIQDNDETPFSVIWNQPCMQIDTVKEIIVCAKRRQIFALKAVSD